MWPYWVMFLVPAVAALQERWRHPGWILAAPVRRRGRAWWLVALALTLLIGYRFEVGGDWFNYIGNFYNLQWLELADVLRMSDPGYYLLNWLSIQNGGFIYAVNLVAGLLFSLGLVVFCLSLPRPWLALAAAIPYLVIVVAMGYSRQGVALGLAMLGLVALGRGATLWFMVWVLLGATFHKSAVILLPIATLAASEKRYLKIIWIGALSLGAAWLMREQFDQFYVNYVEAEYQSSGALIRILMLALPATILLVRRRRFPFNLAQARLWFWTAVLSLVLLALVILSPATTAVDRIGLYLLPLQLVVFAHLPEVLGRPGQKNGVWVGAVLAYYAAVQFVWLNFATHAYAWVPYQFYPLVSEY